MTREVWTSDTWRSDATSWVDARLAELGRVRTGPLEQPRVRPWGTVLHAPTDGGRVWLKAPAPTLRFELPLLAVLDRLDPSPAPHVLALDAGRGLVLTADAGTPLHLAVPDELDRAARFAAVWPVLADVQRATRWAVPDLLTAGLADHRPTALPERFDEVLDRACADHPAPDDVALLDRVAACRTAYVAACERLAASGVPTAVDHNDFHDGNLAVDATGRVVLLDWGDAVIAHPFATLLVAQNVLASLLGDVGPGDPRVAAARRAYLDRFVADAPGEDLEATARLAVSVAEVTRAWVWQRALATPGAAQDPELPPGFDRGVLRHLARAADALA